jgi:hypothetical protein
MIRGTGARKNNESSQLFSESEMHFDRDQLKAIIKKVYLVGASIVDVYMFRYTKVRTGEEADFTRC